MPFEDKFSVSGSILATKAITPIFSGGSTGLLEFLDGILIRQECVSTKLILVLVSLQHVNYLCYLTQHFSSQSQNHYHSLHGGYDASYHGLPS